MNVINRSYVVWHPWSALIYAQWCEVQSGLYMQHIEACQAQDFLISNGNWNSYIWDLPQGILRTNTMNTKINSNLEFALWFRGLIRPDILPDPKDKRQYNCWFFLVLCCWRVTKYSFFTWKLSSNILHIQHRFMEEEYYEKIISMFLQ